VQKSLGLTLVGLFVALFLAQLDTSIVNTALPRIVSEMHGFELYAWVTTGYLLGSTAVVPVAGKLGDRFGRRPLLTGGVAYFLVTTLLCGLAQDMVQLVGLRTLQGVVTSLVQYSRSLGSTLGSALLGAILVLNFRADLAGALPTSLAERAALAEALHWVFLSAALVMASGFGASLFLKDVPFRRQHAEALATDPRPATTADADGSSHRQVRALAPAPARAEEPGWSESRADE